jgi:hypothetical protein
MLFKRKAPEVGQAVGKSRAAKEATLERISTNVMVADPGHNTIYMNPAMISFLKSVETELHSACRRAKQAPQYVRRTFLCGECGVQAVLEQAAPGRIRGQGL